MWGIINIYIIYIISVDFGTSMYMMCGKMVTVLKELYVIMNANLMIACHGNFTCHLYVSKSARVKGHGNGLPGKETLLKAWSPEFSLWNPIAEE